MYKTRAMEKHLIELWGVRELRSYLDRVNPLYHLGQPYPIEQPDGSGWTLPRWTGEAAFASNGKLMHFTKEKDALRYMAYVVYMNSLVSIPRGEKPLQNAVEKTYLIGIDPSVENCALALYSVKEKRIVWTQTYDVLKCAQTILSMSQPAFIGCALEDPRLQSATFSVSGGGAMTTANAAARGQDVGTTMAAAAMIEKALVQAGIDYVLINPSRRTNVKKIKGVSPAHYLPTKTSDEYFQTLTGYDGKTNEHERDAATLVWGRDWGVLQARKDIDAQKKVWGRR